MKPGYDIYDWAIFNEEHNCVVMYNYKQTNVVGYSTYNLDDVEELLAYDNIVAVFKIKQQ